MVDESYRHPGASYTSYYEETKAKAHELARRLIEEEGLPCVIVQPGGVYGPEDHSALGNMINQVLKGRLPLIPFPDAGYNLVHVEDVAVGVLLALDRGRPGEAYVLGGQITTMREFLQTVARVAGKREPRRALPTVLIKASAPFGPVVGPVLGLPPNLREMIRSSDGVTFWARHDKAMAELGYSPRSLEPGLRDMLAAEGRLPGAAESDRPQGLLPGTYYIGDISGTDEPPDPADVPVIEVSGEEDDADLPETDATITARDYSFETEGLSTSQQQVEFLNAGAQPHHLVCTSIREGSDIDDVRRAITRNQRDRPAVHRSAYGHDRARGRREPGPHA